MFIIRLTACSNQRNRFPLLAFAVACFAALPPRAHANNNSFLPGDAYFHTYLYEGTAESLLRDESPTFLYGAPKGHEAAFCGYAGYTRLKYVKMPVELRKNLRQVYLQLRVDYPMTVEETVTFTKKPGKSGSAMIEKSRNVDRRETNPFSMYIYNPSFDPHRQYFGLRYNEDWVNQVVSFGHDRRGPLRLDRVVDLADAIEEEWKNSTLVSPLKVKCPPIPKDHPPAKFVETPVEPTDELKVFIMTQDDPTAYFKMKEHISYFEVTSKGIRRFEVSIDSCKWVELEARTQ